MKDPLIYCHGCASALQMYDPEQDVEGDEMWIAPAHDGQGGERVYCENCYASKLQKQ